MRRPNVKAWHPALGAVVYQRLRTTQEAAPDADILIPVHWYRRVSMRRGVVQIDLVRGEERYNMVPRVCHAHAVDLWVLDNPVASEDDE